MQPSSNKSLAVAQIVAAILNKGENGGGGAARPGGPPKINENGFTIALDEGKICLFDHKGSRITLDELIQYVSRHIH
jgi:hypothetical protein